MINCKDQENPSFSAFDACGSLSNDQRFDPGRLGNRSDGTEITKLYAKSEVERVKKSHFMHGLTKLEDFTQNVPRK